MNQIFSVQCFKFIFIYLSVKTVAFQQNDDISRCEKFINSRNLEDKHTIVDVHLKHLAGTWISEGCETRPGPEYILRFYDFKENNDFILIQHHYWDESCSSPKLTIKANGHMVQMQSSLIQPGANNGNPKITNITIIPQDVKSAKELDRLVAAECSGQFWKLWRRYEEHLVFEHKNVGKRKNWFSSNYHHNSNSQRNILQHTSGHISCLGTLKYAFNELKLLKIQLRPIFPQMKSLKKVKMELLLGDIHTNSRLRQSHNPTSFQAPLLKNVDNEIVIINRHQYLIKNTNTISNLFTSKTTPPHLLVKPILPPYIWGEWTSIRCEIRPMGLYLTRSFYFYSKTSTWIGEHQFYSDPFCNFLKFKIIASGQFQLNNKQSKILKNSYDIDIHIDKANLNVFDQKIIKDMRLNSCGNDEWKINVPQELSTTNGCLQLGIILPSLQKDVIKIEIDSKGFLLLYFGQTDTDNMLEIQRERPTSFQLPLVKCGEISSYSLELLNENYDWNKANNFCTSKFVFISTVLLIYFDFF